MTKEEQQLALDQLIVEETRKIITAGIQSGTGPSSVKEIEEWIAKISKSLRDVFFQSNQ